MINHTTNGDMPPIYGYVWPGLIVKMMPTGLHGGPDFRWAFWDTMTGWR